MEPDTNPNGMGQSDRSNRNQQLSMNKDKYSFYKEHPKSCDPKDFWGQVKRTVNGKPVSQEQIDMIVKASVSGLNLESNDVLLDICCGNGALTDLLFDRCSGGLGVDFSEYLISVAKENFANGTTRKYEFDDAVNFCLAPIDAERFTKAICYGSFSYLEHQQAETLLSSLRTNFSNLKCVFIGNCPDKTKVDDFFQDREYDKAVIEDPSSAIGIWRTQSEFVSLAQRAGWNAKFNNMPNKFYASLYRYDAVLYRD